MSPSEVVGALSNARRIVVKVGSSLVTNDGRGLDEAAIGEWCRQIGLLVRGGDESSGNSGVAPGCEQTKAGISLAR